MCYLSTAFSNALSEFKKKKKKKWLWLVLSASPVAHEMILLYGSELFSKYLPAGPEVGKDEKCHIGWLHQDVKLTVNNMIY